MNKINQQHTIEKQVINLRFKGNVSTKELQQFHEEVTKIYKVKLAELMDKLFTKLVNEDVNVQIDKIELNLPPIKVKNFKDTDQITRIIEREFVSIFEKILKRQLKNNTQSSVVSKVNKESEIASKWQILEHFLHTGHYPNWASANNSRIDQIFEELLDKSPGRITQIILSIPKNKRTKMMDRIIYQFNPKYIDKLFLRLFNRNGREALKTVEIIRKRLSQKYLASKGQKSVSKAVMTAAFDFILHQQKEGKKSSYSERALTQHIVESIQKKYKHISEKDEINILKSVKEEFAQQYSSIDLLEYFLKFGSLPYWAITENSQNVSEIFNQAAVKNLKVLQIMISKNIDNPIFINRMVYQFSEEQILSLFEPLPEENKRFVEEMLSIIELEISKSKPLLKHYIFYFFNEKSRFNKLTLTKLIVSELSKNESRSENEITEELYQKIALSKTQDYSLTKRELQRFLIEINPIIQSKNAEILSIQSERDKGLLEIEENIMSFSSKIEQINLSINKSNPEKDARISELLNYSDLIALWRKKNALDSSKSLFLDSPKNKVSETIRRKKYLEELYLDKSILLKEFELNQQEVTEEKLTSTKSELDQLQNKIQKLFTTIKQLEKEIIRAILKSSKIAEKKKLLIDLKSIVLVLKGELNLIQIEIAQKEQLILSNSDKTLKKSIESKIKTLKINSQAIENRIFNIETEIAKVYKEENKLDIAADQNENSKLDFIIFFLQYGSVPWWAEEYKNLSFKDIFEELISAYPEKLKKALFRISNSPIIWQRLLHQIEEVQLEKLLLLIYPNFAGFAISTALLLQKIFDSRIFKSLESVSAYHFKWIRILNYLFSNEKPNNPREMMKSITRNLSSDYQLSTIKLLEYYTNLSNNFSETRLGVFATIVEDLFLDPDILNDEKLLIEQSMQKRKEEEGLVIADDKKILVVEEYILKGTFNPLTFKSANNSVEAIEKLFEELLVKDNNGITKLLENSIESTITRNRIAFNFSEDNFWEIVLLMKPSALPITKKYFEDLKSALGDNQLFSVKESILHYLHQFKNRKFQLLDLLNFILEEVSLSSNRTKIAVLNEWKRKTQNTETTSSALLSYLMQIEIAELKSTIEKTEDLTLQKSLKDQVQELTVDYQYFGQRLAYFIQKEAAQQEENFELPASSNNLFLKIQSIENEINQLKASLEENPKGESLLKQIVIQRQLIILEGQLEVLLSREPYPIRKIKSQIVKLKNEIQTIEPISSEEIIVLKNTKNTVEQFLKILEENNSLNKATYLNFLNSLSPIERLDFEQLLEEEDHIPSNELSEFELQIVEQIKETDFIKIFELWNVVGNPSRYLVTQFNQRLLFLLNKTSIKLQEEQNQIIDTISKIDSAKNMEELAVMADKMYKDQVAIIDDLIKNIPGQLNSKIFKTFEQKLQLNWFKIKELLNKLSSTITGEVFQEWDKKKNDLKELEKIKKNLIKEDYLQEIKIPDSLSKPNSQRKSKSEKILDEPIFIKNAGLVLLHPYFSRLFTTLKLVDKNQFISEEAQIRGVHILQYIATGKFEHPENELVLNKIICGLALNTPVPLRIELSEEEIQISDAMLKGAIANWSRMKTMTPDALRGTFILRTGSIKEDKDRWKLKVDRGSFDMLLKTLPWAFNFVRSGWMPKLIMVDWPLPG